MVHSVQRFVDFQEQEVLINFQGSALVDSKHRHMDMMIPSLERKLKYNRHKLPHSDTLV